MANREDSVYLAKLAEQAERYDGRNAWCYIKCVFNFVFLSDSLTSFDSWSSDVYHLLFMLLKLLKIISNLLTKCNALCIKNEHSLCVKCINKER